MVTVMPMREAIRPVRLNTNFKTGGIHFLQKERKGLFDIPEPRLIDMYERMMRIRLFEEEIVKLVGMGRRLGRFIYTLVRRLWPLAFVPIFVTMTT